MRKRKILGRGQQEQIAQKTRSGLEAKALKLLNDNKVDYEYEPKDKKLDYVIPESKHKYLPDVVIGNVIYELKGYIPDLTTRMKYVRIQEQNPNIKLVMVFQNPNLKIAKGAKTTYKEWYEKKGVATLSYLEFEKIIKNKDN